jgi:hypothetical protein
MLSNSIVFMPQLMGEVGQVNAEFLLWFCQVNAEILLWFCYFKFETVHLKMKGFQYQFTKIQLPKV